MSNTITNIGRVSGRRNPQPVAVVTVEVNGLSLDMLPGEDPAVIIAQIEAIIAELEFQMSLKWPGVWQPVDDLTPEMVMFDLPDDCAICRKIQPAA